MALHVRMGSPRAHTDALSAVHASYHDLEPAHRGLRATRSSRSLRTRVISPCTTGSSSAAPCGEADLHDPEAILTAVETRQRIDLDQPVRCCW
jgi:hypothetical protein